MIYRTEHPKPQFMRANWVNLNGEWQFEIDQANSGRARKLYAPDAAYSRQIQVPFCPESKLSGVQFTDFMNSVWYKRTVTLTEDHLKGRVFLHFGAVDYEAIVYVNGKKAGSHKGGYVSFRMDITDYVTVGDNILTVNAQDDVRDPMIASGKQSERYASWGCLYTRTTGIWQTVWLEFVPAAYISNVKYTTDANAGTLNIAAELVGAGTLKAQAYYEGVFMGEAETVSNGGTAMLNLTVAEKHLWELGCGRLYDLVLTYGDDRVESYFGLRSIQMDGYKFRLNGRSVYQRLVLDQGFYPDGIYTAPSDEELQNDVKRSMDMGFNGARLHEKVFEERFLYHCDKLGYMVWGEYPNWGLDHTRPESIYAMLPEWLEEVARDCNHPAIIGWCPFNETWNINYRPQYDGLISLVYQVTKAVDPTRPCVDTSGGYHVLTDIFDTHDYARKPEVLAEHFEKFVSEDKFYDQMGERNSKVYIHGQPFFVSEYGGIGWSLDETAWSYGDAPKTEEEFLTRLKGLTDVLLDNPHIFGFCYTQLTDVEQEQNGLYTYDRRPKFPASQIAPIFSRKAVIED
ncbi:MAG: beta-galactosidase [Clostridia bacterium]|nr:beta-galactosidase [Clostridia bacterium]